MPIDPPHFGQEFNDRLEQLFEWRRDVRRFRADPVAGPVLEELLQMASLAPSVGNSQPWRWVRVNSSEARTAIRENFEASNATAAEIYGVDVRAKYVKLKLEGLCESPVHLAVFCDEFDPAGPGARAPKHAGDACLFDSHQRALLLACGAGAWDRRRMGVGS